MKRSSRNVFRFSNARVLPALLEPLSKSRDSLDGASVGWSGIVEIFAYVPAPVRHRLHAQIPHAWRAGGCLVLETYRPEQLDDGPAPRFSSSAFVPRDRANPSCGSRLSSRKEPGPC